MTARKVTRSSGNVFKDIGVANPEQHLLKAKVVHFLGKLIEHSGLTQTAAAGRIGIKQPDLSKVLRATSPRSRSNGCCWPPMPWALTLKLSSRNGRGNGQGGRPCGSMFGNDHSY